MTKDLEMRDNFLVELAINGQKHLWIGRNPPFPMDSTEIIFSTNFRLANDLHQKFDVVWYYEPMFSSLGSRHWRLIFDELIRLIGEEGLLVLRYQQNAHINVIRVKHFLGRRFGVDSSIVHEEFSNHTFTTVFRIRRQNIAAYRSKDWSFCILPQGSRVDNVVAFLKSIRDQDRDHHHEIIISGPANKLYDPFKVKYLIKTYREKYAEISLKKNDIADFASNPNLLICHDRYVLDSNFLTGFSRYGYDFDFLTIRQWYESKEEFPSYCAMDGPVLTWSRPIKMEQYNELHETHYLNGGILIGKAHVLRAIRFNHLLFWNQAEDVEISYVMKEHSLPPRINFLSSATTLGLKSDYTATFLSSAGPPTSGVAPAQPSQFRIGVQHMAVGAYTMLPQMVKQVIRTSTSRNGVARRVKAMLLGGS